jgi:NADH-quinone oxidoreductase subunit J
VGFGRRAEEESFVNPTELALGQAYFFIFAAIAVAGALGTVVAKNPIRGAMGLLLMIVAIAGLFLALHAQFLAAIQLIVYAGAIVVLFLFVIMMLGPSASAPSDERGRIPRTIGGALYGGVSLMAMWLVLASAKDHPIMMQAAGVAKAGGAQAATDATKLLVSAPADFGSVDTFGRILFTQTLLPFELSSALLMVAVVGAVAVARGRGKHDEAPEETAVVDAPATNVSPIHGAAPSGAPEVHP